MPLALIRATSRPWTMRSNSGIVVIPERRMSSWVMEAMAAGDWFSFVSFLETEVHRFV